jgi:hypothetical protein
MYLRGFKCVAVKPSESPPILMTLSPGAAVAESTGDRASHPFIISNGMPDNTVTNATLAKRAIRCPLIRSRPLLVRKALELDIVDHL